MYHFTGLFMKCSEKRCGKEHIINNPENKNAALLYTQAREDGWFLSYTTDVALCPNCRLKKETQLGGPLETILPSPKPKGASL